VLLPAGRFHDLGQRRALGALHHREPRRCDNTLASVEAGQ
jgi:hypothetical protein